MAAGKVGALPYAGRYGREAGNEKLCTKVAPEFPTVLQSPLYWQFIQMYESVLR